MDQVGQLTTRDISQILLPTYEIFIPLLEQIRPQITQVEKRTISYGPTERHKLDIYFPPTPNSGSPTNKHPILFYVYGGGFVKGARSMPPPADLVFGNLATYFAKHAGFITIIADYRLVPEATFPVPARDVLDAITFVKENPEILRSGNGAVEGDLDSVFLMGHSVGAANVSTILLHPDFSPARSKVNVKGAVLISGPYDYDDTEGVITAAPEVVQNFYGGVESIKKNCPYGLLKDASEERIYSLPPIFMVEGENDPDSFKIVGESFQKALETLTKQTVSRYIAQKHNHISLNLALGTGQGEEWAQQAVEWMRSKV
ncbi:alpha/beta-hydrolase [Marasmius fiardii PR-910]|nr:alpha/beta-hydrolase [Marasmius fiardii PR-910]